MNDLRAIFRPTDGQLNIARGMLAAATADAAPGQAWHADCNGRHVVVVGLALPGKHRGIWETGQTVEAAPGYWLIADDPATHGGHWTDYATARNCADDAGAIQLAARDGTSAYAVIHSNGTWTVFEGMSADLARELGEAEASADGHGH